MNRQIQIILASLFLYLLCLQYYGFDEFSRSTGQIITLAQHLSDSDLFSEDFLISGRNLWNSPGIYLMSCILYMVPFSFVITTKILFAFVSILLLSGMINLSDLALKNLEFSILGVFASVMLIPHLNVQNFPFYDHALSIQLLNTTLLIWSIYKVYRESLFTSILLMSMSFCLSFWPAFLISMTILVTLVWQFIVDREKSRFIIFWACLIVGSLVIALFNLNWAQGPKVNIALNYWTLDSLFFNVSLFCKAKYFFYAFLIL